MPVYEFLRIITRTNKYFDCDQPLKLCYRLLMYCPINDSKAKTHDWQSLGEDFSKSLCLIGDDISPYETNFHVWVR